MSLEDIDDVCGDPRSGSLADDQRTAPREAGDEGQQLGGGQLDGDIMQALADGGLQEQLAGATSALQQQLLSITEEMNRLKSEIYSEQGSLAARLGELTERAADLEPAAAASREAKASEARTGGLGSRGVAGGCSNSARSVSGGGDGRAGAGGGGGGGGGSACGNRGLRARPPACRDPTKQVSGTPSQRGSRRVEFAPGTQDPLPMRDRMRQPPMRAQQPGWAPYVVGFIVLCLGPMRPLMWEVLTLLWGQVSQLIGGERLDDGEPAAWYDEEPEM